MAWLMEKRSGMKSLMLSLNSWSCARFARWCLAAGMGLLSATGSRAAEIPTTPQPVLTTVAQVQELRADQAAQSFQVRLRGVMTYADSDWTLWFIHDSTAGIYIYRNDEAGQLEPGQEVELEGYSIDSKGTPAVRTTRLTVLGRSPLPHAQARSFEQLAGSGSDGQWVEIEDLVRSVKSSSGHCQLRLGRKEVFSAIIAVRGDAQLRLDWIESTVRLRGVYRAELDENHRRTGFSLFVPGLDQVQVITPAGGDAWKRPVRSWTEVRSSMNSLRSDQRLQVHGVVTHQESDGSFFVQDGSGGGCVQAFPRVPLAPGDRIEVAGFPSLVRGAPALVDATVHRIGSGTAPLPRSMTAAEAQKGGHEGEFLQVRGRLLRRAAQADQVTLVLRDGNLVFRAFLESTNAARLWPDLREESTVAVAGVWLTTRSEQPTSRVPQLILSSTSSLVVLEGPPWLTVPRALTILGVVAALFLGWVSFSARRQATLKERYRQLFENATDMIYTHTLEGTFISLNPAGERITGWPRTEATALSLDRLVAPEQRRQLQAAISSIAKNGGSGSLDFEILTREGKPKSLEASVRVLRRQGLAVAIEGIARDVSERKRAEENLLTSREQLRLLAAKLQSIREEERTRIARDVHDELGQTLTALKMDIAHIASRLPPGDTALLERAQAMSGAIDASIQTVRKIAADLRPGVLDNLGLVAALEWQAEEFQKRTRIQCDFSADLDDAGLDPRLCTAFFRIFQETLTNVMRHAQAKTVSVTLEEREGKVVLTVHDDGQGILEQQRNSRASLGLLGIQERAFAFGGAVTITGAPGQGTSVTVRVPVAEAKATGVESTLAS